MSYIAVIFVSLFLSSNAGAHNGDYSFQYYNHTFGCRNCDKLGSPTCALATCTTFKSYGKARHRQAPIWPTLPTKPFPYFQ